MQSGKTPSWKSAAEFQAITAQAIRRGALKLAGRTFEEAELAALCTRLTRAGALADARRFFHWELEFPEVFFNHDGTPRESPGFDAVIGNPPYVRIQGFSRSDIDYIMRHFESATGNVDLYVSFIERGFRLLRVDGRLGEIVPNKFLRTDYGVGLRNLIADRNALNQLVDFGASQVFGVTIYTCLLFLDSHENQTLRYAEVEAKPESLNGVIFRELSTKLLHQHPWVFSDNEAASLMDKIGTNSLRLLDLPADMSRGSSTGDDEIFVIENEDIEEEVCRTPIFASDFGRYNFASAKRWKVIFPYVFSGKHYELRTEAELESRFPKAFAHLQHARQKLERRKQFREWHAYSAPRNLELHDRAQIIIPLLADRGLFAFIPTDTRGTLCPMASGGFTITVGESCVHDPRYVLSLINSRLLFWKLEQLSNVFRGGWITCTKQYFGELPIRCIAFTTPAPKRAAQLDQAKRLYEKSFAANDARGALHFVEAELQAERADIVHDLLAFLAERMTAMNQQKWTTAKQFLTDLKDFHGVETRALNPKTKLDEFWKLEPGDVFAHLRKNTKLLAAQKVHLTEAAEENIRSRLQKAKDKQLPLEAQIAFTDQLIDQIVYRLYGLSEGEMQLVEENSKK